MKSKLNRALQIARLIVSEQNSIRYPSARKTAWNSRFKKLVRELAASHGMKESSVNDQIMREAYRLPPLKKKAGKW